MLKVSKLAYAHLLPKEQEMLHSENVLCFGIALILYISYAGDILESLSTSSAGFKPKVKK